MGPQKCLFEKVNYKFAVVGYSCDRSNATSVEFYQRMCDKHEIDRQWIDVDKTDTIEMIPINDAEMDENYDTQKCSALNSSKCVEKLFDEPNAQHTQGTHSNQCCFEFDQANDDGLIASPRSYLKDHLNGNISYSYRTHYYLNR